MNELFSQRLSDRTFARVARLVEDSVGIRLPEHKRSMVELRIARRARVAGVSDLDDYCSAVLDESETSLERVSLIDALTTNKTDFFRESEHFERLTDIAIPELQAFYPELGTTRPLRVWSAGCATGEEPYSIAMVLTDYARRHVPFDFQIRATDVSASALAQAGRAVYPEEHACAVPVELRRQCLLRNKDHSRGLVRVAPEIRSRVRLIRHNLLSATPPVEGGVEVVFCRNVVIYFNRDTQVRVLGHLAKSLVEGGYLFVGHSETLHGMSLPLKRVGPTMYRKVGV